MRIDRIYVAGYRLDLRMTQCCVASVRHWYPDVPITLIKDELHGAYDTKDLERAWGVDVFASDRKRYGWGMGKLEPFFGPPGERFLVLDSDIVFLGRVLDRLERLDEDVVVDGHCDPEDDIDFAYFDLARLRALDPAFEFPGYIFNTGQLVATAGALAREDFAPFLELADPPRVTRPDVFKCGEQGLLNYVLMTKRARGELSLRREKFMWWPGALRPGKVTPADLGPDSPFDHVLHWHTYKEPLFARLPFGEILAFFEERYYERVEPDREARVRMAAERLAGLGAPARPAGATPRAPAS